MKRLLNLILFNCLLMTTYAQQQVSPDSSLRYLIQASSADHIRNDQAAQVELNNGKIVTAFDRFGFLPTDMSASQIWMSVSDTRDSTYSAPALLVDTLTGGHSVLVPSFYKKSNGNILLVFFVRYSTVNPFTAALYKIEYNSDMSSVVTGPTQILAPDYYNLVASDRLFYDADNGRLLMPYSRLIKATNGNSSASLYEGRLLVSADNGDTWADNGLSIAGVTYSGFGGVIEAGLYKTPQQGLVYYYRTLVGYAYANILSYSAGAYSAGPAFNTNLPAMNACVDIKYWPKFNKLLASKIRVIGDPSLVSNRRYIDIASSEKSSGLAWTDIQNVVTVPSGQLVNIPMMHIDSSKDNLTVIFSATSGTNTHYNLFSAVYPVRTLNTNTVAATGITANIATINGVVNAGGYATKVSFTYGTSPTLAGATTTTASKADTVSVGEGDRNPSLFLTGLTPSTTYYFQVSATNNNGTSRGYILSFTTNAPPPVSYPTPQTFTVGAAVSVSPTNTGAAIPATVYSTVSTLAGSGVSGSANGTGTAATFKGLINMVADGAGNIYAADYSGNVIRKVTPAGVATTLAGSGVAGSTNGTGIAATFNGPAGIGIDASGNIYVGDSGNNLIRKITPAGVVTTFAGSGVAGNTNGTGAAAAFHNPRGVIVDAAGNIYVADMSNNRICKITPGKVVTTLAGSGVAGVANGTGVAATFNGPIALGIDGAGNIYVADYSSSLIRKITSTGIVTTFAGSGVAGAADGSGTAASFKNPYAIATDGDNNLYVGDAGNNLVRKITPAGIVTTLAGNGTTGSTNGVGTAAKFNAPRGLAFYQGNLYLSDFGSHLVRKIILTGYTISPALPAGLIFNGTNGVINGTPTAASAATDYTVMAYSASGGNAAALNITINAGLAAPNIAYTTPQTYTSGTAITPLSPTNTGGAVPATVYSTVSTFAGSGASGSANGTGTAATFKGLINIATDAAGNIYAADYTGNVIRKITTAGVATTFAGSGTAGNTNGTGTAATFNGPLGIVVDAGGNIYVGDSGNNIIRKITPDGLVTTFAGSGVAGNANGTGTVATFRNPRGLAVDASGNIYVADMSNNLVRKITPGAVVTTFAGSGAAGSINGTGTAATFNAPIALATDGSGNIYVAEYTSSLIRKITPGGVVTTFAGSVAGAADGTGTAASFKNPYAVTTDRDNNLYVADAGNNLIRKISPATVVTTLAGSGTAGSTSGVGTAAKFNAPHGVVFYQGNLYVADYGGHQVRKVILTGYTISPVLPAGLAFSSTTGIINGTPTAASPAANYTVTAYNATGGNAAVINITVNAMGGMALAQSDVPQAVPVPTDAPNIRQGLSPNGDGIADVLIIDNIEKYPDNKIAIMNSGGGLVYEAKGYNNLSVAFNGHSTKNGKLQRPGTYFYRLDYKDEDKTKHKTGFILLKY